MFDNGVPTVGYVLPLTDFPIAAAGVGRHKQQPPLLATCTVLDGAVLGVGLHASREEGS